MRRLVTFLVLVPACTGAPPEAPPPTTVDTDTAEPRILPQDSFPLPTDSAPDLPPDLTPAHWVTLEQQGMWDLEVTAPWESMSGTLRIREFVDELDTAAPAYECDVTFALTGPAQDNHSCDACDFVFAVEHYLQTGDPSSCHDPDVPNDGSVWMMGFDGGTQTIYRNYGGTGLWLPWYEATRNNDIVSFEWTAVLAIEVMDSGTQ